MTDIIKAARPKRTFFAVSPIVCGIFFLFCLFTLLGIWQIHRFFWKINLIMRIEERVHLPPIPAPSKSEWPNVTTACCDYLPVQMTGRFLNNKEILITALTSLGSGYWVLTPFETEDGSITFINRGFVPMDRKKQETRLAGQIRGTTKISGLLRMGEENGLYPHRNDPMADLWYTRELASMARVRGFLEVAPYFIDVDQTSGMHDIPIGGMTRITFSNNHLTYAMTWFVLAGGVLLSPVIVTLYNRKSGDQQINK
ncbi:MAG: surfeit locus 1 family protein [Candidatus Tokpelaia sp. JSC085]|nr:MAG: surfeit locus 1 family protein [Candidatus Tokpelaia sp. JSC085]